MNDSTSSRVEIPVNTEHGMSSARRSREDHSLQLANPLSFLSNPDFLSSISDRQSGVGQTNLTGLTSSEFFPTGWNNDGMAGSATPGDMSAQLDLAGTSFNEVDLNSVDFLNSMLSFDPMFLSNALFNATGAAFPSSVSPPDASTLTFDTNNFYNLTDPTNIQALPLASSSIQAPDVNNAPPSTEVRNVRAQHVRSDTSSAVSNQEAGKLAGEATQNARQRAPALVNAEGNSQPNKVPIPRLRPPLYASKLRPGPSAQEDPPPSPSAASATSRTKLSHRAVERRYRTNMRQHIKNLREVVPALRVLELKPGNRISNLSLRAGTRGTGTETDRGAEGEDVVDERGYIDGVQVARNGSKTTAVLKTMEYIRVLKRREIRLKREYEGLKNLVRSFPGGAERLQQWEVAWKEKFGGSEKDEIETETGEEGKDNRHDGGIDSTDNDDGYTSKSGPGNSKQPKTGLLSSSSDDTKISAHAPIQVRAESTTESKKYVAIRPAPTTTAASSTLASDSTKRKRGRPRKDPLPSVSLPGASAQGAWDNQGQDRCAPRSITQAKSVEPILQPEIRTQPHSGQHLFAVFTLVSFFVSPLPLSSTFTASRKSTWSRTYSGSVIVRQSVNDDFESLGNSSTESASLDWRDALHLVHLAFSVFMVFSFMRLRLTRLACVAPKLLLSSLHRFNALGNSFGVTSAFMPPFFTTHHDPGSRFREGAQKLKKLANGRLVMPTMEAKVFGDALGLRPGVIGLLRTLLRLAWPTERHEYWRLERRVFMRFVELMALDVNTSVSMRLQVLLSMFHFRYGCSSTATELASLALLIHPIWRTKSVGLWELAVARLHGRGSSSHIYRPYETFVLENVSVDEAAEGIVGLYKNAGARVMTIVPENGLCRGEYGAHRGLASPLAALTRQLVHERIRRRAGWHFVQLATVEGPESPKDDDTFEYDRLLVAGRSLDPPTVALLNYFDQVCNLKGRKHGVTTDPVISKENVKEWGDFSEIHGELKALVDAIVLLEGMTGIGQEGRPSVAESSTSPASAAQILELKRYLGSTMFDRTDALRNARSRVLETVMGN